MKRRKEDKVYKRYSQRKVYYTSVWKLKFKGAFELVVCCKNNLVSLSII